MQMQQESTTYSSNGNKRRKLNTLPAMATNTTHSAVAKGWWIGLTITINKDSLKCNHNNIKLTSSTVIATIHDYNHETKESQIWIMNSSNSSQYDEIFVDHINFNQSSLCYTINGDISNNQFLSIPPDNHWKPMPLSIGCTVTIHHSNFIGCYQEMKGIIDAFDKRSRRHHITYHPINNRKMSEWLWCSDNNTKLLSNNNNTVITKSIQPPPFDPVMYGLAASFIDNFRKRSNCDIYTNSPPNKKRKISTSKEEPVSIIRIPKMTEKANHENNNVNNPQSLTTDNRILESKDNREIITISSSQSASPPKVNQSPSHRHRNHGHHQFIDLCEDQEEEIVVGTREYREYNRQLKRRQKEQKRRHKKDKKRRRHLKYRGSSKYPRKAKLGGIKWKRKYAKEEKKYYWVQKHNESHSSWNPWKDNGQIAPWLKGRSNWEKWYDADNKRYYYYNPLNGNSTYQRPADYSSPEEIDHDSVDDDDERFSMEKIKPTDPLNDDQDVQMIAVAHPKPSHKHARRQGIKHRHNSRRNKAFDPNAGGFSFFDVPTNTDHEKKAENGENKKHSQPHEEDPSINRAVTGLSGLLTGEIITDKDAETIDSKSREETVESQRSESMEDIFDHNNDGRYDTDAMWKECWSILEPKVRENPSIKFQELLSTHAKGWNLMEEVVKELKNAYNETVVEIFQSKTNNELTLKLDDNDGNDNNGNHNGGGKNGNSSLMDIDVNNGVDTKKKTTKQTVWAQLVANLQSVYKSQNKKAIKFVLEVYQIHDHEEDIEQRAKCWSILTQNADHLVRIIKSDRKGFIEDITKILLLMIGDNDDDEDGDSMKVDVDDFFQTFGFEFMDEYIYSLIQYGKSNKQIIKIISILSKSCIVYQLIGCMRINELLNRWNIATLVKTRDIFNSNNKKKRKHEKEEEVNASILLAIKVLKLIEILTKGISSYDNKDKDGKSKISKLQKDCICVIQGNVSDYIPNGFALDVLFQTLSSILKYNLETNTKSNLIIFELCCNILTNLISIDEPIIFKLLNTPYKRSKRIILFLHKTYTELRINARHRSKRKKNGHNNHNNHNRMETESDDDSFYNNTDSDDMSPRKLINRVIQPYEFKNYDDASFEPYGIELDISQREDSKPLSNIDCRESIADILLKYVYIISMDDGTNEKRDNFANIPKYKYLICNIFYQALTSKHLVKVSWGYNKALNHYHRDNICIDWIKQELLYQHKLDGREHPDQNNQPQRHFRICSLIEILFDPLIWDYQIYYNLLQTLCNLCIEYKTKTNENMTTWKKLKQQQSNNDGKDEIELMNLYTSNLWNEIVAKCKSIIIKQKQEKQLNKNDLIFLQLLHQCVLQNDDNRNKDSDDDKKENDESKHIDVTQLCSDFETMLRSKNRSLLSKRGDIDVLISQFLRSNTLHLLVGLTQMEATCVHTRNCARRGIRCIVWSVNQKSKKLLKKSQIPFLPTINYCYTTYSEHQKQLETLINDRKHQNILVVGDGNLSFGRALSRIFGNPSTKSKLNKLKRSRNNNINDVDIDYGARNVIVTCYESAMELLSRYPHSGSVVAEITDRGGFVLYGIDATSLKKTLTNSYATYGGDKRPFPLFEGNKNFSQFKYDVIIWNFPHAMNRSYNPKVNGDLVENFFISAKEILKEHGEIHITLHINHQIDDEVGKKAAASREYRQYETWGVGHRAELQQLRCIKRTELNHRLYPGYAIKNVQGNPFNIVKAETYIFKRISEAKDL